MRAAIDFGITNTDIAVETNGTVRLWLAPSRGEPNLRRVRALLAQGGVAIEDVELLAVTGGHHRRLPAAIGGCRLVGVSEVQAIGRGGQLLAEVAPEEETPLLIVSAGSGVAMIAARGRHYAHITGTGVGGGTLLGLARLLLHTIDPAEINALAETGDANGADLALIDVVSGPIGRLPPDATAVNFGRVARRRALPRREDLAAALVTMVSQVIGTLAINAARAGGIKRIVVTGHLTDMSSVRANLARVSDFFGLPIDTPQATGGATALGALRFAVEEQEVRNQEQ